MYPVFARGWDKQSVGSQMVDRGQFFTLRQGDCLHPCLSNISICFFAIVGVVAVRHSNSCGERVTLHGSPGVDSRPVRAACCPYALP